MRFLFPKRQQPPVEPSVAAPVSSQQIDQILRDLARLFKDGEPHFTEFGMRFRAYEQAILNVKQLGFEMARAMASTSLAKRIDLPVDTRLTSSLCKQIDMESDWLAYWCAQLGIQPIYHRKIWELAYVCQALFTAGVLEVGRRGLVFGVGEEPLPALFAKLGCSILATDLDPDHPEAAAWRETGQHGALDRLRRPDICPEGSLLHNISFRSVNMNEIPDDLNEQFDFCWSACALEHLGSLENGMRFIENSISTLKPGGVAVHTTEFNLGREGETFEAWPTVLYQRRHIEALVERLTAMGRHVAPVDFAPGEKVLDRFVDLPPFLPTPHPTHLTLLVDGIPCTSIGLIIRKS